jgi:hypothetical protein
VVPLLGEPLIGNVYNHSVPNVYYYRMTGLKKNINLINYLSKYELKTKKFKSYNTWLIIINKLNSSSEIDNNLINLAKLINV